MCIVHAQSKQRLAKMVCVMHVVLYLKWHLPCSLVIVSDENRHLLE